MKILIFTWHVTLLSLLFFKELLMSVLQVMRIVILPPKSSESAILEVPLDIKNEKGVVLFANMITLTPGTLTLHISEDRTILYIHVLSYSPDTVTKLKNGFEKRIMSILP